MAAGLREVLGHLQRTLPAPEGGPSDGQLLARFVAAHDEAAFAALLRRHGGMVLGVARRVVRHAQDAEDVFQATFLILARKAGSVAQQQSVGNWLYRVAYRAALRARATSARRRAREQQVEEMPQPAFEPAQPQDWRSLLDEELNALPQAYRTAVVLCELEGVPRKEAASRLGVPEGTLSSRLAGARKLLAQRLTRRGFALPAGALGAALAVPPALASATARVAALVAAGQTDTVAAPAVALMKGVLKAMLFTKLKLAAVVVLVGALGAGGVAYQVGPAVAQAQAPAKPRSELEELRRQNDLLRLNLEVVLEKVRAQEAELRTLKGQVRAAADTRTRSAKMARLDVENVKVRTILNLPEDVTLANEAADPVQAAEAALKALREARDPAAKKRAAEALENATRRLREQHK
jgi:RNA polymerase sigma factor (sigma-70 family)